MDALAVFATRRWYVVLFLIGYLVLALRHLGPRRTLAFTAIAAAISWASEVPSIRWGFPYGLYHYLWGGPSGLDPREASLLGVPCFSTLSYVFLSYAALCTATAITGPAAGRVRTAIAAAVLIVALDMVIDPIALRGEEWFLGKIYHYPGGGEHFGVPVTNYAGWLLVGFLIALASGPLPAERAGPALGAALYFAIAAFNIGVTFWIGAQDLAWASVGIAAPLCVMTGLRMIRSHEHV